MEYDGKHYIIQGSLEWNFDDANRGEEVKKGKFFFEKLSRWIRTNWPAPAKRENCRGPVAQTLIQYEGYLPRGFPPNINVEYVKI